MINPEAGRCLLCKKARCREACPVYTDVPRAMALYRRGDKEEAARLLFDNNPFSGITCIVCDWKKTCFGSCVLGSKGKAVKWYEIEKEISSEYLLGIKLDFPKETGKKVAVAGAGPAGITAALKLREKGFGVVLYDDHERMGGVIRYGIPSFRLERAYIDAIERIALEAGISFVGNTIVGRDIQLSGLLKKHDAVLVAGGAWKPRKLDIPGEEDERIIYALEYLMEPDKYSLKGKVLIIGGGNVTMDASRTALRQGCDAQVYYRKGFENMPANISEVEEAKEEGVKFHLFEVPVAIRKEGGKIYAVMRKCENVTGEDGKLRTRTIEGSEHDVEFDHLIVAISENVDYGLLGEVLSFDGSWPSVDDNMETSCPGLYLCGDFLTGPSTVVEAVQSAKDAVEGIINRLK